MAASTRTPRRMQRPAVLLKDAAPGAGETLDRSRVVRRALSNVQFGEGFVTLYRHPPVFGLGPVLGAAAPRAQPAHQAGGRAPALSGTTPCDEAEELFMDEASSTQGSAFIQYNMRGGSRLDVHRSGAARIRTAQTTRRTRERGDVPVVPGRQPRA